MMIIRGAQAPADATAIPGVPDADPLQVQAAQVFAGDLAAGTGAPGHPYQQVAGKLIAWTYFGECALRERLGHSSQDVTRRQKRRTQVTADPCGLLIHFGLTDEGA